MSQNSVGQVGTPSVVSRSNQAADNTVTAKKVETASVDYSVNTPESTSSSSSIFSIVPQLPPVQPHSENKNIPSSLMFSKDSFSSGFNETTLNSYVGSEGLDVDRMVSDVKTQKLSLEAMIYQVLYLLRQTQQQTIEQRVELLSALQQNNIEQNKEAIANIEKQAEQSEKGRRGRKLSKFLGAAGVLAAVPLILAGPAGIMAFALTAGMYVDSTFGNDSIMKGFSNLLVKMGADEDRAAIYAMVILTIATAVAPMSSGPAKAAGAFDDMTRLGGKTSDDLAGALTKHVDSVAAKKGLLSSKMPDAPVGANPKTQQQYDKISNQVQEIEKTMGELKEAQKTLADSKHALKTAEDAGQGGPELLKLQDDVEVASKQLDDLLFNQYPAQRTELLQSLNNPSFKGQHPDFVKQANEMYIAPLDSSISQARSVNELAYRATAANKKSVMGFNEKVVSLSDQVPPPGLPRKSRRYPKKWIRI